MPTHWVPLESNPDVLNSYTAKLGAANVPSQYGFVDVLGLDAELLAFVPSPVLGVLLLFPITETKATEAENAGKESPSWPRQDLFYMKQTIGNACGTIGLLHLLCNASGTDAAEGKRSAMTTGAGSIEDTPNDWNTAIRLAPDSFLSKFIRDTTDLSPEQRGEYLEHPPNESVSIDSIHEEAAHQGSTAPPDAEADVDLHFVAFVAKCGSVWELDGRKAGPIDHGATSQETFLSDVASVVGRQFVEKAAGNLNFSLIALSKTAVE